MMAGQLFLHRSIVCQWRGRSALLQDHALFKCRGYGIAPLVHGAAQDDDFFQFLLGKREPPTHLWSDLTLTPGIIRSEEHTSELQSLAYLVCRLLLEKKKTTARVYILSCVF